MRRRDFIGLAVGAAAAIAAPRMAWAQPAKMPRIGVLLYSNPQADPNAESFRRSLRELGYVEGAISPSNTTPRKASPSGSRSWRRSWYAESRTSCSRSAAT
jgi:hypothetical protein